MRKFENGQTVVRIYLFPLKLVVLPLNQYPACGKDIDKGVYSLVLVSGREF